MFFEWDDFKNQNNLTKHGVSFEEAQEAFFDEHRIIIKDVTHSIKKSPLTFEKPQKVNYTSKKTGCNGSYNGGGRRQENNSPRRR